MNIPLIITTSVANNNDLSVLDNKANLLYTTQCLKPCSDDINDINNINAIAKASETGFHQWNLKPIKEKIHILSKAVDLFETRKQQFVDAFMETGIPLEFSQFNADQMVLQLQEYIKCMEQETDHVQKKGDMVIRTVRTAIGPVYAIAPWNAPGILTLRTISAPLAAGCSVVFKSSELNPKAAYLAVKTFHDVGVPPDTLQLVHCKREDSGEMAKLFIQHPSIRKVSFTGSSYIGAKIAALAGANLKPSVLELGGKNCAVIRSDADLESAVTSTLIGSWLNNGHICMSTDMMYVDESIYEAVIEKIQAIGSGIRHDFGTHLRTEAHASSVKNLVQEAAAKGASFIVGNSDELTSTSHSSNSSEVTPLVLTNITPDMEIYHKETFGPILCILKYSTDDQVIQAINGCKYGLKTSIWTQDRGRAQTMARTIDCGGVHINGSTVYDDASVAHGGVKASGYGRFNSSWGINEFSYDKVITET